MDRFEITASNNGMFSLFHSDKGSQRPDRMTAAVYACTDTTCGQTLIGNNSVLFGCPSCRSNMTAGKTKDMTASEINDLKKVGDCGMCGCDLLASGEAMPFAKKGKLYCVVCSDVVTIKADESDENENKDGGVKEETNPEQEDFAPDTTETSEGDGLGDDEEISEEELPDGENEEDDDSEGDSPDFEEDDSEEGEGEDGDNSDEDEDENLEANDDGVKSEGGADKKTDDNKKTEEKKSEEKKPEEKKTEDNKKSESKPDDNKNEEGSKKEEGESVKQPEPKPENIVASLLAAVGDREVDINLIASPNRKKWYMFADDKPVAISEKGRCAEGIRELFDTDKFVTAYVAATEGADGGVTEDVLNDFGFDPIETSVPVDEAIRQTVEAQVSERAKAYSLNADSYNERMGRCLGLAAVGMIKGTFKDANPVEKSLVASLQRMGQRDAEMIVVKAFENNSLPLMKTLMLRANELMEKEDSVLTEIANLVEEQKFPSERSVRPGLPPAAMATLDDERLDNAQPKVSEPAITASTGRESNGSDYRRLFQKSSR